MVSFRNAIPHAMTLIALVVMVACQSADLANGIAPTPVPAATSATTMAPLSWTPMLSETPRGTATPSNDSVIGLLLQTPQPTLPMVVPANETGIKPGQTEAEVRAVLGDPKRVDHWEGMTVWSYWQAVTVPNQPEVFFSPKGTVQEIYLATPGENVETIIAAYGPPEFVLFYVIKETGTYPPGATRAPLADPYGRLLYLSKGLYFTFGCSPYLHAWCLSVKYCTGVPREAGVYNKIYFRPTTLVDWRKAFQTPDDKFCLKPWTGFAD